MFASRPRRQRPRRAGRAARRRRWLPWLAGLPRSPAATAAPTGCGCSTAGVGSLRLRWMHGWRLRIRRLWLDPQPASADPTAGTDPPPPLVLASALAVGLPHSMVCETNFKLLWSYCLNMLDVFS